jgi:hypothetical protein
MGFRFATWPHFNGKKVVLEDDDRLGAAIPTYIPPGTTWKCAENTQGLAWLSIKNDGSMVISGTLVIR